MSPRLDVPGGVVSTVALATGLLALALPPAAAAQTPGDDVHGPPAPAPEDDPRPLLLNRLELIVNDRCLTRRELDIEVYRAFQRTQGATLDEEGRAELVNEIVNQEVDALLKTQGGMDLGFDENLVSRLVSDHIERREERAGGASMLGDELARFQVDSGTFHDDTESYVLSQLWTGSVQGYYPGPGGRPYVDTFISPQRLRFEYRRSQGVARPESSVEVQEMLVDAQRIGDARLAKATIEELRERVVAGEDFGAVGLEARAVPPDTLGVYPAMKEQSLLGIPGLDAFLPGAEPGDVSPVLPIRDPETGALVGFRIVKLLSRTTPEPPPFGDSELQADLTKRIRDARDRIRVEIALEELREAAYVWPRDAAEPGAPEDAGADEATPSEQP